MRGFWADERLEGGIWKKSNPLLNMVYNYFKRKEKVFLQHADTVISLTGKGKEVLSSQFEFIDQEMIQVIPCCADTNHFDYKKLDKKEGIHLKEKLGIDEKDFVLSYLGSIGTWYMLPEMLAFFRMLLRSKSRAKFLFISREDPATIYNHAKNAGIPVSAVIVCSAKRKEVPLFLSLSDVNIFFIKAVFSKQASSPTKHAEVLSMGIPVITNAGVGDTDRIIDESKTGTYINQFSNEEFYRAIQRMDELLKIPKEKIRQAALDYFSLESGVEKYHHVYQQLSDAQA